jgi:hypothetical protein
MSARVPEATVDQEGAIAQGDAKAHVGARQGVPLGTLVARAGAHRRDREPQGVEHVEQQGVVLEAVAATAPLQKLLEHVGDRKGDGLAEQDAQVLEGNGLHVRRYDRVQGLERGALRAVASDASEVRIQVHGATVLAWPHRQRNAYARRLEPGARSPRSLRRTSALFRSRCKDGPHARHLGWKRPSRMRPRLARDNVATDANLPAAEPMAVFDEHHARRAAVGWWN